MKSPLRSILVLAFGIATSVAACSADTESSSKKTPEPALDSHEVVAPSSEVPTSLSLDRPKDDEPTRPGKGSAPEPQEAEQGGLGEDDMSYLNAPSFMRIDQTPPDMIIEASDECLRRQYALSEITASQLLENYPVMAMVVNGTIQAAYGADTTLNLIEYIPEENLSPVLWAVRMRCHDLLDWLQDRNALGNPQDPSGSDRASSRAVRDALYLDNTYALALLLESGYDATAPAYDGFPLLHHALSSEAVEILTAAGADPNGQVWIARPIDVAARTGRPEVVRALYPLTENPSTAIYFALMEATARSNWQGEIGQEDIGPTLDVLKTLRKRGADINYPRPAELGGAPPEVTSAVDFARYQIDQGMDPTFLAFIEDWASEQAAKHAGEQSDQ